MQKPISDVTSKHGLRYVTYRFEHAEALFDWFAALENDPATRNIFDAWLSNTCTSSCVGVRLTPFQMWEAVNAFAGSWQLPIQVDWQYQVYESGRVTTWLFWGVRQMEGVPRPYGKHNFAPTTLSTGGK